MMGRLIKQLLFWSPRVLGVLFALFLGLFALDVFSEDLSVADAILAFLIHLIPTYVVLIVIFIAWNRDDIGAIIFFALALFYIVSSSAENWVISGPMILIGGLYLIAYILQKTLKNHDQPNQI